MGFSRGLAIQTKNDNEKITYPHVQLCQFHRHPGRSSGKAFLANDRAHFIIKPVRISQLIRPSPLLPTAFHLQVKRDLGCAAAIVSRLNG